MKPTYFTLPAREQKPRSFGMTCAMDGGLPTSYFEDVIKSHHGLIDLVKFGWGTCVVTEEIDRKIEILQQFEIDFHFGGSFFEKALSQNKVDEFFKYCENAGAKIVEISDGTLDIASKEKAQFIRDFSQHFKVLSEVGYKDSDKSQNLHPSKWVEFMRSDLDAGASYVITEAREGGTSGICRPDGELRFGLIEEILDSNIKPEQIIFEAPKKPLQVYFIKRLGPNVNLANISFSDIVSVETIRLGLRGDTLTYFQEESPLL